MVTDVSKVGFILDLVSICIEEAWLGREIFLNSSGFPIEFDHIILCDSDSYNAPRLQRLH